MDCREGLERGLEMVNPDRGVSDEPRVAVVFASFNRKEVACECVRRLRAQTRQPDWVIVGDNASEDGSAEALGAMGWDRLDVLETGGNLGNAGAVRLAMDEAFSKGADAVWILDDDSWPREDALERLLYEPWEPEVVRHPIQLDPETNCFTWPLQVVNEDDSVTLCREIVQLPRHGRIRTRGVWTGALVSRLVRDRVGEVNAALFIRGEDEEYPWRIEQAGFSEEVVIDSVLDHPGPVDLVEWKFLGKRLYLERGLADWKLYYKVRNMVWLKKKQAGRVSALAMGLAYGAAVAMVDGAGRVGICWDACRDGWTGRLGRRDF